MVWSCQKKYLWLILNHLNLDNGIILIQDGLALQTYMDGKFSLIERKKIEQSTTSNNEDTYEYESLGNLDYFSMSIFMVCLFIIGHLYN